MVNEAKTEIIVRKLLDKYKEDYVNNEFINDNVKNALKYIVDSEKYNI